MLFAGRRLNKADSLVMIVHNQKVECKQKEIKTSQKQRILSSQSNANYN